MLTSASRIPVAMEVPVLIWSTASPVHVLPAPKVWLILNAVYLMLRCYTDMKMSPYHVFSVLQVCSVRWTWMNAPQSSALAVRMAASVWMVWDGTLAPALLVSLESIVREMWTSVFLDLAIHPAPLTVCRSPIPISAAVVSVILVRSYFRIMDYHTSYFKVVQIICFLSYAHLCSPSPCRATLWVNGGSVPVQTMPQQRQMCHEHEFITWIHLYLPTCKCRVSIYMCVYNRSKYVFFLCF